ICRYVVPPTLDLAPSISLGAIDKNRLGSAMFARAGMAFGFGIISCIGGHEVPQQRVLQGFFKNRAWHNHDALSFESFVFFAPLHKAKSRHAKWRLFPGEKKLPASLTR